MYTDSYRFSFLYFFFKLSVTSPGSKFLPQFSCDLRLVLALSCSFGTHTLSKNLPDSEWLLLLLSDSPMYSVTIGGHCCSVARHGSQRVFPALSSSSTLWSHWSLIILQCVPYAYRSLLVSQALYGFRWHYCSTDTGCQCLSELRDFQ